MKIRTLAIATVVVAALLFAAGLQSASADPATVKKIETLNTQAMENYDLLDYEEAKKLLNKALATAKRKRLGNDPVTAKVHMNLAIVEFSGFGDAESAELQLIDAVNIDPRVAVPAAYKTSELQSLLDKVKSDIGGAAAAEPVVRAPRQDTVDCGAVDGIEHQLIEEVKSGTDKVVDVYVGAAVGATQVSLYYRPEGAVEFTRIKMAKKGGCKFVGTIPAGDTRGEVLHYFVAAENAADKPLASRGSKGSPNIIEVLSARGGASVVDDDEDPLGGGLEASVESGDGGAPGFFISMGVASGAGYVTGSTEQAENDVGCCFAPALLSITPEIGTYLSDRTSLSIALRLGVTVGANIDGHSPGAPAGFLRLRHGFDSGGTGLTVNGALGFGVIRHTVSLAEGFMGDASQDTDTQVSGPLFLGGGLGYMGKWGNTLRPFIEVNALAGLPVVSSLGSVENVSFALTFDANLGIMFAF